MLRNREAVKEHEYRDINNSGKISTHLLIGGLVILIAVLLERTVYTQYDHLIKAPVILNDYMAVAPVYNTDGSWLHGKWGIGYNVPLLCLEWIVVLCMTVYLFRFMESFNLFFRIRNGAWWLYAVDMEAAVMVYRLFSKLYSPYTLDYLYIRGQGTFDFPDLCIGAGIVVILLWTMMMICKYYAFKKRQTTGMSFLEKFKWDWGISLMFCKAALVSKDRWPDMFAGWKQ